MVLQIEAHKTRPKSGQKLTFLVTKGCSNTTINHICFLPVLLLSVQKNGGKRSFSVNSCIFNGEKRPTQKIKNQQSITPFALKTIWTLSKTSKKCTSAVDAKGKKKNAKKGEYLVQTFKLQCSTYLWLASW